MAEKYFVFDNEKIYILQKGMCKDDVKKLLGNSFLIESCKKVADQKWIYQFGNNKNTYKILFREDCLQWALKGNFSQTEPENFPRRAKVKRKNKLVLKQLSKQN